MDHVNMKSYVLYDCGRGFDEYGDNDRLYPGAYSSLHSSLRYVTQSSRLIDIFSIDPSKIHGVNLVVRLARYKGV